MPTPVEACWWSRRRVEQQTWCSVCGILAKAVPNVRRGCSPLHIFQRSQKATLSIGIQSPFAAEAPPLPHSTSDNVRYQGVHGQDPRLQEALLRHLELMLHYPRPQGVGGPSRTPSH